jgi:YHS domain-containing protein
MNIPQVDELEFFAVDTTNWPDTLICHCCGKKLPHAETGCMAATIEISGDASVDFHFCSKKCVDSFVQHPAAQVMIDDVVGRSMRMHNGR